MPHSGFSWVAASQNLADNSQNGQKALAELQENGDKQNMLEI
ncbi:hypothetical protein CAter282_2457 [Collimonas arenae]|uniref:Uncharacterized protein n=1 Tax=Collimonas arenae TaxID=279058 RepID=A0A127PRR1_9BURK|nr:hypothetical protein CAter10_2710 [Collimonas arenae]AMP10203.1 hypothetical protein CAter282_2457 [Collimonas arenae]